MKALLILVILSFASSSWAQADSTQNIEVRKVIDQLFDGMRAGDSTMLRAVFHQDARLFSSYEKDGKHGVHMNTADDFIYIAGTNHEEVWDEQIYNVVIQLDDGMAQAWMDYSFFLGGIPRHFGVNSMQLVRVGDEWKIISLINTRRTKN